jgi:DNA-binding NarL/FixJ family response regulator
LLDAARDLELVPATSGELGAQQNVNVVLLGGLPENGLLALIDTLKTTRAEWRIVVTGTALDDETVLRILAAGAKGYVHEASPGEEFAEAIRIVAQGGIWASRRVLALLIERSRHLLGPAMPTRRDITSREQQVLEMLVEGRSNKEIAAPLGIEERTVKAHIAKLMRKVGMPNRIALSVHALTHSLVPAGVS